MSKRIDKNPRWKLDDTWAVDVDAYNFILYSRGKNKDGLPTKWNAKGFYPTAQMLLSDLYEKLSRTEDTGLPLLEHLKCLSERVQATATHLNNQINAEVWSGLHRPPAHKAA